MEKEEKLKEVKGEEVKTEQVKKEEPKKEVKKQEAVKKEEKKPEPNKTKETKKVENKEKNVWGIAIVVILILALVIGIGCAMMFQNSPNKCVDGMLNALKAGDFVKVNEYVNYQELMQDSDLSEEGEINEETQKLLFDKLDWKIEEVKQEANKASVKVEITNKDYKTIIGNYMQKALKIAFTGTTITEQEMENYLIEELKNDQVQTVTVTKTIQVEKQEGEWKVVVDSELMSGLMPGLEEAVNSLNSMNVSE